MTTYTLHHGDCLELMPTLEAGSVDAVICDPPYGTTACKWDSVIPFAPMWEQIKRLLKPRGACVLFGSQPFTSALVMSNPAWFRYEWVWHKPMATGAFNAEYRPLKAHENILVFSDAPTRSNQFTDRRMTYYPQGTVEVNREVRQKKVTSAINNLRGISGLTYIREKENYPRSVITMSQDPNYVHPTQKPLALLEYLVKTYTDPSDTVLDFTMGSGTTGHACINLDRHFIGIEQDAGYYAIAEQRLVDASAQLRLTFDEEAA